MQIYLEAQEYTAPDLEANLVAAVRATPDLYWEALDLLPTYAADVELPILFAGDGNNAPRRRSEELLNLVGLGDRLKHRPSQLSVGEQQRVAIARALANAPDLILADEPTGNLDTDTGGTVLQALLDVRHETGTTLIIVTHDTQVAGLADRLVTMRDGALVP